MNCAKIETLYLKNQDAPFTDILSILKQYKTCSDGLPRLNYETDDLNKLQQFTEASVTTILKGLQNIGYLMSLSSQNNERIVGEMDDLGVFITSLGNLVEGLNALRLEAQDSLLNI